MDGAQRPLIGVRRGERSRSLAWADGRHRRVPGKDGRERWRQRQRARVHTLVRALPPAAVPVLPLDREARPGRAGRASVGIRGCACGPAPRAARRAVATVAVPDRAQRGHQRRSWAPGIRAHRRHLCRCVRGVSTGSLRGARAVRIAGRGSARAARTSAGRIGHEGAQRAFPPGDRACVGYEHGRGEADDLRGAHCPCGVRGGPRDAV